MRLPKSWLFLLVLLLLSAAVSAKASPDGGSGGTPPPEPCVYTSCEGPIGDNCPCGDKTAGPSDYCCEKADEGSGIVSGSELVCKNACARASETPTPQRTDFTIFIPIVAVIVAIFLAIMHMLATSLSLPSLEAWVKTELRELIAGAILAVLIYSLFISSTTVTSALTGRGDYFNYSAAIIDDLITNKTQGYDRAYTDIIRAASKLRIAASYAPYMSIPSAFGFSADPTFYITYSDSPLAGISPIINSLAAATQGLSNNILLWEAVRLVLKLSEFSVTAIILPLGLALRMIPFMRQLGNTLIALSLALILFLPFSIILVDQMHKTITYPQPRLSSSDLLALDFMSQGMGAMALMIPEIICGSRVLRGLFSLNEVGTGLLVCLPMVWIPGAFTWCFGTVSLSGLMGWWTYGIYPMISLVTMYVYDIMVAISLSILYAQTATGGYAGTVFNVLYPFLKEVNNLVVLGYLDFALIGIITITGARSISAALGGEWYMAGIQRLI